MSLQSAPSAPGGAGADHVETYSARISADQSPQPRAAGCVEGTIPRGGDAPAAQAAHSRTELELQLAALKQELAEKSTQNRSLKRRNAELEQRVAELEARGSAGGGGGHVDRAFASGGRGSSRRRGRASLSASTFSLGSSGRVETLAPITVAEKNALQKMVLDLMPAGGDVATYSPEVMLSYATGRRLVGQGDACDDAEGAGPGLVVAAKLVKLFKDAGMPSFSGLHVPPGEDWKQYFEKLDSDAHPETARCRVLVVLVTRAFYNSLPCLEEVATALRCQRLGKRVTKILPVRIEDVPFDVAQWPQLDRAKTKKGSARAKEKHDAKRRTQLEWRESVRKEFGKLNSHPPPGATLLDSPILVNDLVQGVARHLGVDAEQSFNNSLKPLLREWVKDKVPSVHDAAVKQQREIIAELEGRAVWSAKAGENTERERIAALAEPVASAIRATAEPFAMEADRLTHSKLSQLGDIIKEGNKLFEGMYTNILKQQVRNNDGFGPFCMELSAVKVDASRYPQRTKKFVDLYADAAATLPAFEAFVDVLARRAAGECVVAKKRVAPLKHVFRVLQKQATRVDGGVPHECETACDVVRGSIVCESMGGLRVVLRLLLQMQDEGRVAVVRCKDRFRAPTAAGWADAVLNIVCLEGSGREHVCELQLIHAQMLKARKELGGHNAYAAFREAAELFDFAVCGLLVPGTEAAMGLIDSQDTFDATVVEPIADALKSLTCAAVVAPRGSRAVKAAWPVIRACCQCWVAASKKHRAAVHSKKWFTTAANTRMRKACKEWDAEAVRHALIEGADATRLGGREILKHLEGIEDVELIQALVAAGLDVDQKNKDKDTALIVASHEGEESAALVLVAAGADLDAVGKEGETALVAAIENGHTSTALMLIAAGADVNAIPEGGGSTALIFACNNQQPTVAQVLIEAGADVNVVDNDGDTALLEARDDTTTALELILAGADMGATDESGDTALMRASEGGHAAIARMLVDMGDDVNVARGDDGNTPLIMASANGHTSIVEMLVAAGADVNRAADTLGGTALMNASEQGHLEIVERLITAGANLDATHTIGPALVRAARGGSVVHTDIVRALLAAGAGANVGATDERGTTALDCATESDDAELVQILSAAGAIVSMTGAKTTRKKEALNFMALNFNLKKKKFWQR